MKLAVEAAKQEFLLACSFHEAWKPMAMNKELHERLGVSQATYTFQTIRRALRRELILSLSRLWDKSKGSLRMASIGRLLRDEQARTQLLSYHASRWPTGDYSSHSSFEAAIFSEMDRQTAAEEAQGLKERIRDALIIIGNYEEGGVKHGFLQHVLDLRHNTLAHRRVGNNLRLLNTANDHAVDTLYVDMLSLLRLLMRIAAGSQLDIEAYVSAHEEAANYFWRGVRGENTEGHPDFQPD